MARLRQSPADALNRLLRRCVECPPNVQPTCPDCSADETCSLLPATCDSCASMVCVNLKSQYIPGIEAPKSSTPIGGIVGGVIGGVVLLIVATLLGWRFCVKRKKRPDLWEPPEKSPIGRSGTNLSRTHSIASTVMTRASNVIQIAYIPGVTVRSPPESPEILPPMPSIPSTYAGTSTQTTPDIEQHFFMPKDLRDSVWSETSSIMTDQRISIAPSLMARDTIYQENAVVPPIPAQYAYIAQANAVSVRSGNSTPSIGQIAGTAPAVPQVPKTININGSSIVARNVVARPIEVKKIASGGSATTLTVLPQKSSSRRATPVPTVSDEKEVVFSSPSSTVVSESPLLGGGGRRGQQPSLMSFETISATGVPATTPADGPLGNSSTPSGRPTTAYAEAMIHEAMFRATQDTSHSSVSQRPELKKQDSGPFSDENAIN